MKHHPKVILLGDTGVGKTSLINALIQGNFKQTIANTLGVCFHRYKCDISKSQSVQIDIWDTAGQEKYRSLLTIYYKNTDGVILIFDLSRPHTFQTVMYWARQVQINSEKNPCIVLVGNKSDLKQQMQVPEKIVSKQKVQQFLKTKTNWKYFQSSAKDNKNVEQIFKQLTRMIIKANQKRIKYQKQRSDSHKMIKNRKRREERSCC